MTVHEISNYFNQSPNMENAYKQHKSIGRLIRSKMFKYSSSRHWENMDLVYKITYIKANRSDDLLVNIKVSGTMGRSWRNRENTCITEYVKQNHTTSRRRNDDIRRAVRDDVQKFFRLFGMDTFKVEIGKIKVCKELYSFIIKYFSANGPNFLNSRLILLVLSSCSLSCRFLNAADIITCCDFSASCNRFSFSSSSSICW